MRFLVLTLVLVAAACASHRHPPTNTWAPPAMELDPPTAEHCNALIQDIADHMAAVDFNKDRKRELTKYLAKARAEQAKGRFDKCVHYAKKAVYWSR
ncbi:MAG TPA: hypothetical protein VEH07_08970 [Alphaproteobacteria bacterium]|nr:hypothetical protein [Alphaproteobacteria bacterium]